MLGQFWGEGYALVHSELVCKLQPSLSPQWILKQTFFCDTPYIVVKKKILRGDQVIQHMHQMLSLPGWCQDGRANLRGFWGTQCKYWGTQCKMSLRDIGLCCFGQPARRGEQRILLARFQGINHTGITLPKARTEEFKVVKSRIENERKG